MSGPYVTIIVPPLAPGMEPQTLNIDVNGPKHIYIIGEGMFGVGFQDPENASQTFGGAGDQPSDALKNALSEAGQKISDLGLGAGKGTPGGTPSPAPAPTAQPVQNESSLVPGVSEGDVEAMRGMGFDDNAIKEYYANNPPAPAATGTPAPAVDPANPMPGVPVPDLKDMEDTEARIGWLEGQEDKEALGNKKLALGLFRNAKDEGRQDLVDRVCSWLGLPEMIVETQAPKSV